MKRPNLYDLDYEALEKLLISWGEKSYRAGQVWNWLYNQLVTDFSEMTSLSKTLRQRLEEKTRLAVPQTLARQESLTGETRKDLLALADGEQIEVVLMRYAERRSVCISTQVGCAVGCPFCATGQMGLRRDLSSGEIVAQVLHFARELAEQERQLTNVVLMGMGEPLLNYDASLSAIRRLMHPDGMNMGQRRFTISTVGISPGIHRLADEGLQVNLAVSLHAATDRLRDRLLPINKRYNLDSLFSAIGHYLRATNRRVTFEWVLIEGVNDTPEQATALGSRLEGMLAHINLIPLNPTAGFEEQPSSPERTEAFTQTLDRHHVPYSVRLRRGIDIQAGCGQLRQRETS